MASNTSKKKTRRKTAKKKVGRPKGAKTKEVAHVDFHPPACVKCGCTKSEVLNIVRTQEYPGVRDGKQYERIIVKRTRCTSCGQILMRREFHS